MQQLAGEAVLPGPVRDDRRVLVSSRDDDLPGVDVPAGGLQPPAAGSLVDPVHVGTQPQLDPVLVRVPVQVFDDIRAGGVVSGCPPDRDAQVGASNPWVCSV
jgi:hypothetical protein